MPANKQVFIRGVTDRAETPRLRCFCLRGGVKMSALQSVMSQLVISIRCNCITPAAESDSKKGGRRVDLGSLPAHWHRCKRAHKQDVSVALSAWCIFLSITMPLLIVCLEDNSICHIDIILIAEWKLQTVNKKQRKEECFFSASYFKYLNQVQPVFLTQDFSHTSLTNLNPSLLWRWKNKEKHANLIPAIN